MTKQTPLTKSHLTLIFGLPALLIMSAIYLTTLPLIASQNFSYALTLDLILTIPLVYLFLIRKTQIPKLTVVSFFLIGVFISSYFIPNEHQEIANFARYILLPFIEFSIAGFIIFRVRQFIVRYKSVKDRSPDFLTTLRLTAKEILPKQVAELLILEIAMIYYCFLAWKKPTIPNNAFTYHKKSGLALIFGVLIGLVLAETFVFHILVERWSTTVAWIGTTLSLYSIIQIIGIIKSAARRPIIFEEEKILLRFGLMHETEIPFEDIEKVELSQRTVRNHLLVKKLGTEITSHNVILFLKKENTLHGLFGIERSYDTLLIFVDEKKAFKEKIDGIISKQNKI